jgi:hypothetical protein
MVKDTMYPLQRGCLFYGFHLPPTSRYVSVGLFPKLTLESFGTAGHMKIIPHVFVYPTNMMVNFP